MHAAQAAAYSSIAARRGFEQPDPHQSTPLRSTYSATSNMPVTPAPARQPTKAAFSEGVRAYVRRAFDADTYIPGIERKEVEEKLKEFISEVKTNGTIDDINWDQALLPQQMILMDRQRAAAAYTAFPQANSVWPPTNELSLSAEKKRNHSEFDQPEPVPAPPWRQASSRTSLADRITYAQQDSPEPTSKKQRKQGNGHGISKSELDLERRRNRFGNALSSSPPRRSPEPPTGPVIGTCQTLEKRYLRLTSAPKPEAVRPLPVLEKTLDLIKKKWKQDRNYGYACDQLKSLRQDLTVQHIKNEFTVTAYEIHARIALEKEDLGEYNQCQTQLKALYSQNLGGHPAEFLAYRILYFIHTNNRSGMTGVLAELTTADKTEPAVAHALNVRSALALGNYHKFFQLYLNTPNMGAYLMDMFVKRERLAALANISRAYKPDVPVRFITEELGFETERECWQFICEYGGEHLLQEQEGGHRFAAAQAGALFENAKSAAFRKVDIKGQI